MPATARKRKPRASKPKLRVAKAAVLDEEQAKFDGGGAASPALTGFAGLRVVSPDAEESSASTPDEPTAVSPSPAPDPSLELRIPTVEDVDRLWDWVRVDGPGRIPYIDRVSNSQTLHGLIGALVQGEQEGVSALRSLVWRGEHVGFGYLHPVMGAEAVVHAYLGPAHRTMQARRIFREALTAARTEWPEIHLVVVSGDRRVQQLAARLGFTTTLYVAMEPR